MFRSIKWKFVLIYVLLIFIAMVIVGVFIVKDLETQQIANIRDTKFKHIERIINTSSYLIEDNWEENRFLIQDTLNEWRLDASEKAYIIVGREEPVIIASSLKDYERLRGVNALAYRGIDPNTVLESLDGERKSQVLKDDFEGKELHLAYPVLDSLGRLKGIFYMVADLDNVLITVRESKRILASATAISLVVTLSLGFIIANSITEPIRDVTKKAEEMSKGNFDQHVEVKSNDEIGQLAKMFNHLTRKLKLTLHEMDLERSKLNTIFQYMKEGILAIDLEGNIIHANPVSLEILDLKDGPNVFPRFIIDFDQVDFNEESSLNGDKTVTIKDNVYKIRYGPFKNEIGMIGGLILVFQNITEEYKLEEMRKEFVANVSHELKTPITTIKSYTETIRDIELDREMEKKFLSIIDDETDRMARLVGDLLKLSNLDYGRLKLNLEELDINKLLDSIILKQAMTINEKGHDLSFDKGDLPKIKLDRDSIEQVLSNIVSNAVKYTKDGGRIKISTNYDQENIYIKVEDNGIGIPEEDLDRIFERFYRVEKGRSRAMGGTGLGLAIAKEIIEAHGGTISISSQYNKGSQVLIKLARDI